MALKLNPTLGPEVVAWIETYLVHGPGDVQGTVVELDEEWTRFIYSAYEVYPPEHPGPAGVSTLERSSVAPRAGPSRNWRRCSAARKRWGRFASTAGSGKTPIGAPVTSPIIKCLATEEGQAGNTYDGIVYMLNQGLVNDEYRGLDVGLTRINLPDGGSIEPVTAAARSKDGGKETFVVADEVHLWTTPELHRLYATVTRNITKRRIADGWLMVTSTMYAPGEGSVAESIHAAAKAKKMAGLLWDHREAPADLDITDDAQLRTGLTYVYGAAAEWTNVDAIIAEFHDPTKTESDNRRYWLNQPAQRADRLFDPLQHKVLERPGLRPADGTTIVMGFDGSENRDSTALIGWTVEDVLHRFTIGLWERPRGVGYEDWHIPRGEVDAAVYRAFRDFDVKYMVCDPAYWHSELTGWDREFGEDVVVKVNTRDSRMMVEAVQRYTVALAEGRFTHDADPDVQRHIDNWRRGTPGRVSSPSRPPATRRSTPAWPPCSGSGDSRRCRPRDRSPGSSIWPTSTSSDRPTPQRNTERRTQ